MREDGYFYYRIHNFGHFYEVRKSSLPNGRISKNFSRPLFTVIFRPKIVFSGTDSIFRVRVMHDPVKLSKFEKGKKSKCLSDF